MTDQALSQLCDQVRELLPRVIKGPWRCDDDADKIWAPSEKGGETFILDVRGWGYLTGKGSGALGLPHDLAISMQKATGDLAALSPTMAAALLKLREERDAAITVVREMVTANAENMRLAASAEAKLAEIANVVSLTATIDHLHCKLALDRIHAIATSGKGE